MSEQWFMVLQEKGARWSWCVVSEENGTIVRRAQATFRRYIDAYEDAKVNGCLGMPGFVIPG